MHEIITLQFGQQANYVGTHFWNCQESYFTYAGQEESPIDHDACFRAGIGADGSDTYTPRTLIYDLKGAFGTLQRENALYQLQQSQDPIQQGLWHANAVPLRLPAIAQSEYQLALDSGVEPPQLTPDTVRFWSDYNRVFYHPRSIVQLNEYELSSSLMPFEQWQSGDELFNSLNREHDLLDRDLRPFLEECDQVQGIQIFTGTDDAWGGFTAKYLECIADDLGKGCRWVFGLQDAQRTTRDRQMLRASNTAQSLFALQDSSSIHIPLTNNPRGLPSYVDLGAASRWQTSALQCAAIESITLPTRIRGTESARATFDNLESVLDGDGKRRLAACAMSVREHRTQGLSNGHVEPPTTNGYEHETFDNDGASHQYDISLFPDSATETREPVRRAHTFSRIEVTRGERDEVPATHAREHQGPRTSAHTTGLRFALLSSYPGIFKSAHSEGKLDIDVSLETSTNIANRIRAIEREARRLIRIDDREALCDGLAVMAEEYDEGWMSSDDSDED